MTKKVVQRGSNGNVLGEGGGGGGGGVFYCSEMCPEGGPMAMS